MQTLPPPLIESIVRVFAPQQIVLFGSHARGTPGPDSDFDLLVVVDDDVPAETLSWRNREAARGDYQGAVDIIPCRKAILQDRAQARGSLAHQILRDGIVIYERP